MNTDRFGFPEIVEGELNEAGQICGKPPAEVNTILKRLMGTIMVSLSGEIQSLSADRISSEDLEILNGYAAKLGKSANCTIRAIYGCGSCIKGVIIHHGEVTTRYGNWVETDCGPQCWYCCIGD